MLAGQQMFVLTGINVVYSIVYARINMRRIAYTSFRYIVDLTLNLHHVVLYKIRQIYPLERIYSLHA